MYAHVRTCTHMCARVYVCVGVGGEGGEGGALQSAHFVVEHTDTGTLL